MFVCSPAMIVANFVHLMSISGDKYPSYTRTTAMPGIAVSTKDILDALEQVGGKKAVELVTVEPDESVLKIVRTWPGKWITERAVQLGCKRDNSILGMSNRPYSGLYLLIRSSQMLYDSTKLS
ncbi:hypothetical protein EMMF5_001674 [Cystobasidiomycetes sp. EMM_F5]